MSRPHDSAAGCSENIKDDTMTMKIVVVGAGVIGLETARHLLDAGHKVIIIAEHFPGDTSIDFASPWAGAHFRPHSTAEDHRECRWDMETYSAWMKNIEAERSGAVAPEKRSGLDVRKSTLLWDNSPDAPEELWFSRNVLDFKVMTTQELVHGAASGATFTSVAVNVSRYLRHLEDEVRQRGASLIRDEVETSRGLESALTDCLDLVRSHTEHAHIDAFVIAAGLRGGNFCGDDKVYPVRGQTVLVRGEAAEIVTRQGADGETGSYIAYAIPRPGSGTTVLGGCNQVGRSEAEPDAAMTRSILQRCRTLCPSLLGADGAFDVLSVNVGVRPAREGGARVERQVVTIAGASQIVVHAYGHGGAGYQNSVGVAREVTRLVTE